MRARKMRTIATRWWPSDGGDHDWTRVKHITWNRHDQFPQLLRALARTAPQGGLMHVGTDLIEDLVYQAEESGSPEWVVPLILSSGLDRVEVFELLTGVFPRLLKLIDARTAFDGVLSDVQLAWLLDEVPDRGTVEGTLVADGDGVRVIPGISEWEGLYGPVRG